MDVDEIQQIFFQECEEGLAGMEVNFATLRDGDQDPETINSVFRCVHSIKGGAGAFGYEALQAYTHQYETLLDLIRNGSLELTPDLLDVVIGAFDMLTDHVAAARDGSETPADEAMLEKLLSAAEGDASAAAVEETPAPAETAPAPEEQEEVSGDTAGSEASGDDYDDLMGMLDEGDADNDADNEAKAPSDVSAPEDAATSTDDSPPDWKLVYHPVANAFQNAAEPLLLVRELVALGAVVDECDRAALPSLDDMDAECAYFTYALTVPGDVAEEDIRAIYEFTVDCEVTLERASAGAPLKKAAPAESSEAPKPVSSPAAAAEPAAPEKDSVSPAPAAVPQAAATPAPPAAAPQAEKATPAPVKNVAPPAPAAPAAPAKPKPAASVVAQTIRVDLDKLDRLVNLVGELVITQSMLAQRMSRHQLEDNSEVNDLEHLTRELQESTMAIRAQPMKVVFSRVPRIVRELESETGKRVRLEMEGEMTEVDKTVVERLGEPLTHLIRNAVDHGLETPEERLAAGKAEEGIVRLTAAHQSGRIVITVTDDGRGINRARVREKAVEREIIMPDATLSDEEIDNLIFAPGFSTAGTVSNVSGRGVGMDVVRKNIQALGGRIGIQSRHGEGSSFSLSLPLTLAVLDGMIVTVGAETFVIPLNHIIESLRPTEDMLKRVGNDGILLDVRGAYVPVLPIADHLGIAKAERNPARGVLIVVDGDQGQAALLVDAIQDQRQVVVKSLEANYQAIEGVAGATILGDGQVALIVDVETLTANRRNGARATLAEAA
ncbi:chemotaxis protein CheA [Pacificimonas sp. WHA3]|uniref:Chemotaxis protein CheA n=1 Tax=Pacificimonas pallii TaxID=2827236 RepID=A0ABS6SFH0_9SPHN|nr:chemotaxis protein CheA [Pacificimonas pallii]MBV7257157.1 chemotaxis protein CheA [Pacificimonas pallii]